MPSRIHGFRKTYPTPGGAHERPAPVALPAGAAARLSELTLARDLALDSASAAVARLNRLPPDADQRMRDALAGERDKHQARHRVLAALSSKLNQWLMQLKLPAGATLEMAPAITVEPRNGEKLPDCIARLRSEIASTQQSLQRVRSAGLPLDAQHSLIVEAVAEKARRGRPSVHITNDAASISWSEGTSIVSLMAWLHPREMIDSVVGRAGRARRRDVCR